MLGRYTADGGGSLPGWVVVITLFSLTLIMIVAYPIYEFYKLGQSIIKKNGNKNSRNDKGAA